MHIKRENDLLRVLAQLADETLRMAQRTAQDVIAQRDHDGFEKLVKLAGFGLDEIVQRVSMRVFVEIGGKCLENLLIAKTRLVNERLSVKRTDPISSATRQVEM